MNCLATTLTYRPQHRGQHDQSGNNASVDMTRLVLSSLLTTRGRPLFERFDSSFDLVPEVSGLSDLTIQLFEVLTGPVHGV